MPSRPSTRCAARTVALLALLAAASSSGREHVVKMRNDRFVPERLSIQQGDTVRWTNPTLMLHTVTADPTQAVHAADVALPKGAEPFNSGNIQPGQEFTHTFEVPGRYTYFCTIHERSGMVAHITVLPGKRPAGK